MPRAAHVTGDLRGHEIALVGGQIWIASTLLSCLCTIDDESHGFVPRWRPPFVPVTGQLVASHFFEAGCTEPFDLQVLPGMHFPTVVGFQDQTLDGILIAPPAAWQAGAIATS